jgi:hypothetical protein
MLCLGAGIEAHDEMVAGMMCGLEFLRRLREEESAPVGHATHDAFLLEDDLSGGFGDSGLRG